MKTKILILFAILILTTIVIGTMQAEPIYDYGNYSVNNNVTISACLNVNVDKLYANITKPDNTIKITSLSCGGTNYCQPSWIYCTGIFKNANVSGIYNVSFYSDKYELSNSFRGYFTVFEGTFLNVTFPLNNSLTNNRTIIIKGLTNGTNVSINKDSNNFTAIVVNGTFLFPLNLTEGENVINIAAYGKYRFQNLTALRIFLDTIPPEIRWINYSNSIRIYKTFRFALNITDNVNLTYVSANMVLDDITENLFIYFVDGNYVVNVEPTRTGDWILKIKACDSAGNCNESSFSYYAYQETENEEKPKISILPSNRTENVSKDENKTEYENKTENKNETLKEQIVIYTHGNLTTTLNASRTVLENISATIYAIPSEKGIKFEANGSALKNFEFYVNGTKVKTNEEGYIIDEKSKGIFWDSLKESYEKSLKRIEKSKILTQEGYAIGKVNSSKELQIIDGTLVDLEGNLVKEDITIELENGEKILVKGGIIDKESIKIIEKAEKDTKEKKDTNEKIYKEDNKETGRITNLDFENIEEGDVYEAMVRDNEGNLIKDGVAEITLPNGEKIKVKTDKNGKVKLTNENGKTVQVEKGNAELPEKIEEGKGIETEVRDSSGNLIKDGVAEITLPNGEKIKVKTDKNGKVKLTNENGKTVQVEKGNAELPEKIEEGKGIETEVRDSSGNLIKDGVAEITLPNGEKIKVRTDKDGKVKLMQKDGKIEQINATNIKIPEIKENENYKIEVRDENGNLIKNSDVDILLPNGQILNVLTDENGKVNLQYKDEIFSQIQKQEFEFRWYYLLPLLLIPLLLYLFLKEDVILSYEFYKKLKEENKLREIEKYGKKYMLKKYICEVNDIKVIFIDSESEEQLAKKLKLKILK